MKDISYNELLNGCKGIYDELIEVISSRGKDIHFGDDEIMHGWNRFGLLTRFFEIQEKYLRIEKSIIHKQTPSKDIEDAVFDLIAYSTFLLVELRRRKKSYEIKEIAIRTKDIDKISSIFSTIGASEWIKDKSVAEVSHSGFNEDGIWSTKKLKPIKATMLFNEELGDLAVKLFDYTEGDDWHKRTGISTDEPFISHLAIKVNNLEERKKELISKHNLKIVYEAETSKHTNKNINCNFHYIIFDTKELLGFNLELVEKT